MITFVLFLLFFGVGIVYSSFFEWALHRFLMHRPFGKFDYAFRAHAVVHHRTFRADDTYELQNHPLEKQVEDKITIPMAWWNGPVLICIATLPFILWSIFNPAWVVVVSIATASASYYGFYERIHWCMHYPKGRWFENTRFFKWRNAQHLIHHRSMHRNFNVVLPIADKCLGTLALE